MDKQYLYMILVGCKPPGRNTEQHDVFFAIGPSIAGLVPLLREFWPVQGKGIHVDAWRRVGFVDGWAVRVEERPAPGLSGAAAVEGLWLAAPAEGRRLYFINLGGYRMGEFEEFHYKLLTVASSKEQAIQKAKETAFFKHTGFKGAPAHVDDKYGIDVDDIQEIGEMLAPELKERYTIVLEEASGVLEDEITLGYFPLASL
jgi:hypothetical protein